MAPIVTRQDGSEAYLPTDDDAAAYATDVGGTWRPDEPSESPVSESPVE